MTGVLEHTNTPGIYYVITYVISSCLYISVCPRRLNGWRLILSQAVFALVLGTFMVITDGIDVAWYIPCVLFEIFLVWLSLFVNCKMDWKQTTYFCARAMMLGEFAASLEWQLYYYGLTKGGMELNVWITSAFLILCHGAVFSLMFFLEWRFRERNGTLRVAGKELSVSCLMTVLIYAISNMSYALSTSPFSSQFPAEIFIIRTLADFGGVGMLFAYHMLLHMTSTQVENDYLQRLLQLQYDNYKISADSVELVNQKYHDLKHQIRILRSAESAEEKNAYLDHMEAEIMTYEAQNKTGNKVLDIILTTKSLQCQKLGITLTCVAEGAEMEFMHPMDISALFGNALDNAIESVSKIEDADKRLIHVSVSRQKNFLRIRIENCYEGHILFEDGMPQTDKKDHRFHGYGMKSIRRIAEQYGGSMTIVAQDNWFELRVLIPLSSG